MAHTVPETESVTNSAEILNAKSITPTDVEMPLVSDLSDKTSGNTQGCKEKVYVCLGETGNGKSTFINYMHNYACGEHADFEKILDNLSLLKLAVPVQNYTEFLDSDESQTNTNEKNLDCKTKSHTLDCKEYVIKLGSGDQIKLIDTPGFNATEGFNTDDQVFEKIIETCLHCDYLNGVILFINGSCPRLQTSIRNFIEYLLNFLSNDIAKNIILILTNTDELSCNITQGQLADLNKLNTNPRKFFMQNSFFNWSRQSELGKKQRRELSSQWINSQETIKEIVLELDRHEPVSTEYFQKVRTETRRILKEIRAEIDRVYLLMDKLKEIEMQNMVALNAKAVMLLNEKHTNDFVIDAIPLVRKEHAKANIETSTEALEKKYNKSKEKKAAKKEKKKKNSKSLFRTFKEKVTEFIWSFDPTEASSSTDKHGEDSSEDMSQSGKELEAETSSLASQMQAVKLADALDLDSSHKISEELPIKPMEVTCPANIDTAKADHFEKQSSYTSATEKNSKQHPDAIKITVQIDDDRAISQFKQAKCQEEKSLEKIADLNRMVSETKSSIDASFGVIEKHIGDVKAICKSFNFVQFFFPLLNEFQARANAALADKQLIEEYYDRLYQITQNAATFE